MLHWRHKILRRLRRQLFWAKLFFVSFVGHLLFFFLVLFVRKGDYFSYKVVVNRKALTSGAPVVFLPFHKVVQKKPIRKIVKTKKKKSAPVKKTTVAKIKPGPKSKAKPKPKKQTKLAAKKKTSTKKQSVKKAEVKKKKAPKKVVAKKKTAPKKKPIKTVQAKKVNTKKQKKQIVAQKELKLPQKNVGEPIAPIYVGQLEMEALRMQDEMQTVVGDVWKPPAGLPKDLECVLKILVNWKGKATETVVEKTSGVLMYDISARTAVARMELPQWAHGKEFHITFKQ